MPRAQKTDFLQGYSFWVETHGPEGTDQAALDFLASTGTELGQAGFQSVTIPEISSDAIEYREGHRRRTYKLPGLETYSDCTLMRGVVRTASPFFRWAKRAHMGEEYRAEVTIYHFDRSLRAEPDDATIANKDKAKRYALHDAFPIRVKVAGDLDATSAEISMTEMDVAVEGMDVYEAGSSEPT